MICRRDERLKVCILNIHWLDESFIRWLQRCQKSSIERYETKLVVSLCRSLKTFSKVDTENFSKYTDERKKEQISQNQFLIFEK